MVSEHIVPDDAPDLSHESSAVPELGHILIRWAEGFDSLGAGREKPHDLDEHPVPFVLNIRQLGHQCSTVLKFRNS